MAGVFKEAVLTAKGIALLAKAQAGRCTIKLTKAATGDGSYSDGEALTNRTALKSKKQEFRTDYSDDPEPVQCICEIYHHKQAGHRKP